MKARCIPCFLSSGGRASFPRAIPGKPEPGTRAEMRSACRSRRLAILTGGLALVFSLGSRFSAMPDEVNPFTLTPSVVRSNGAPVLFVAFHIPPHHHIYADRISAELNNAPVPLELPAAQRIPDKFSGGKRLAFEQDFKAVCLLPKAGAGSSTLSVTFQGCSDSECYFPETRQWRINSDYSLTRLDGSETPASAEPADAGLTNGFQVAARATGYLNSEKFLSFLGQSRGGQPTTDPIAGNLARFGMVVTLGLILLGGLALNLTPCVLPMIPINLAILGAGAHNQNRRRGFLLGSAYGGGMALVYGLLGLAVVLTGSKFGALNASPWFNFAIAVVFAVLGLAMFDRLAIDFSRFQRRGGKPGAAGSAFLAAGVMGAVSASLAGACVAPVVISVLLLATTLYQHGNFLGLLLPFVLGVGMAVPWPFAAAGLSFLPKPGAWMTRVKYAFGVFIFGFAAWYGWLGWSLSGLGSGSGLDVVARSNGAEELRSALEKSRSTGRPVMVDFWAGWCKNCEAMEHSTFRDAGVREQLRKNFIVVKFEAERLNDTSLKPVLDQFGVLGLPTYVILVPEPSAAARTL